MSKTYLICGSRNFENPFMASIWIDAHVRNLVPAGSKVIHGGARGADRMAAESAERNGCDVAPPFLPDWDSHGKKAGIMRNLEMLDQKPDAVIAFWNGKSPGTKHTITEAERRGIKTVVVIVP